MTQDLFDDFISELSLDNPEVTTSPFVLVDTLDGSIRLLTGVVNNPSNDTFLAYTLASEGELEVMGAEAEE